MAQAEHALAEARGKVIAEVTKAFFHLTAAKAAVQVREEAVAQAIKLQALQAIRFEHGSGDLAPLLQVQEALARPRDLQDPQVGTLFVLSGLVFVQTIVPEESASAAPPPAHPAPAEFDDITQLFIAHVTDPSRELLVREGERMRKGQLLARLAYRDQELERRTRHAEAQLQEKETALALQEAKVHQARALVGAGLAAPGAVEREEAHLLRAREAIEQSRRELARLAEEARRLAEVRSPVDGQILTIRVHVIHGSEGTAVLRLLYRKASVANNR